ncbi:hypothetical protein [Microlunatus parietis]|uniref:Capsular polysaccharide biosynthesis protein n=1 Tax=Microlunatus parietis TaxID=682979 RepID=A0A7Y9LAN3_9ACTN|nr:hypothetical protein [Microlunatus parietis]NYE73019.1 hypothetical protein [Microlunatus parietis]
MDGNSSPERAATPDRPATGIYLSDVLGMLRRRWYVVLVGLLLVAGGTGAAYLKAPLNYQATGQLLLLLPPQAAGGDQPINPYLNLDSGLATTAALIASTLNAPESQRAVESAGYLAEYSIALSPDTGPLLVITTEARDPQQAIGTRDEVIRRLQEELKRIQTEEDAPKRQFIHTRTNSTFNGAEVLTGDRIKAVAAVAAAGLLTVLLVVVIWDRMASRRRARPRAARSKKAAETESAEPPRPEPVPGPSPSRSAETTVAARPEPAEPEPAGRH